MMYPDLERAAMWASVATIEVLARRIRRGVLAVLCGWSISALSMSMQTIPVGHGLERVLSMALSSSSLLMRVELGMWEIWREQYGL